MHLGPAFMPKGTSHFAWSSHLGSFSYSMPTHCSRSLHATHTWFHTRPFLAYASYLAHSRRIAAHTSLSRDPSSCSFPYDSRHHAYPPPPSSHTLRAMPFYLLVMVGCISPEGFCWSSVFLMLGSATVSCGCKKEVLKPGAQIRVRLACRKHAVV